MYAVILAGGGGTRLWPLSRASRPKPFLPLLGDRTLLQASVDRLSPLIEPRDVYVVTDARYAALAREQLPEVPPENVIEEPVGRNTAAAVALATVVIQRPPEEVMAVLPADSRIADEDGFREALATAARHAAASGDLVTLGIPPTRPETGYGYVVAGEPLSESDGLPVHRVARFVEKPSAEAAAALLAAGNASWNAGSFVWRRDAALKSLGRHASDILGPIRDSTAGARDLAELYPGVRATSIDYALMEPAAADGNVAVVPLDVGWSDLGNWGALLDAMRSEAPEGGVIVRAEGRGDVIDVDSEDTLVHAQGDRLVVTIGLRDIVVIDTPDAVLVCSRDAAQDVKRVVDRLAAEGRRELL